MTISGVDTIGDAPGQAEGGDLRESAAVMVCGRFLDEAPSGGEPDLEGGSEAGVGVGVAEMGQGEQGLPAGIETPPPRAVLLAVPADTVGQVVQGPARQWERGG